MAKFHEWLERNKETLRDAYESGTVFWLTNVQLSPEAISLPSLVRVLQERDRQQKKWGEQNHNDGKWALILLEELGEFAKDCLEGQDSDQELVEVAAVALAWLDCRKRAAEWRARSEAKGGRSG